MSSSIQSKKLKENNSISEQDLEEIKSILLQKDFPVSNLERIKVLLGVKVSEKKIYMNNIKEKLVMINYLMSTDNIDENNCKKRQIIKN
jgi:hypothetical protein